VERHRGIVGRLENPIAWLRLKEVLERHRGTETGSVRGQVKAYKSGCIFLRGSDGVMQGLGGETLKRGVCIEEVRHT
jgi:hypothetical protein